MPGRWVSEGYAVIGARPQPASTPIDDETAALIRHDLVNPINLIVGYTDLLLGDLVDSGRASESSLLESIRDCGFRLLRRIDGTLLVDGPGRSAADVEKWGRALGGPTSLLVRQCDDLLELFAGRAPEGQPPGEAVEFADDIRKIRAAGLRMHELAEGLSAARSPGEG